MCVGGEEGKDEKKRECERECGSDSVRFTHGIVDAYLHRHTSTRPGPVDITIKPAFASTLSFFDFAVVVAAAAAAIVVVVVVVVYLLQSTAESQVKCIAYYPARICPAVSTHLLLCPLAMSH